VLWHDSSEDSPRPYSSGTSARPRCFVAEAIRGVIVDHAYGLHEGVADGRSHELEAAAQQIFAHGVGLGCSRGKRPKRPPFIHFRLPADELPDVLIETAELFLDSEESFGIFDRGRNLQLVANDARIAKQFGDFSPVVARDFFRIESVERAAVVFPLIQDSVPAQSGLRAFEYQEFEQHAIVVEWDAPLFVVIADR